MNLEYTIDLDGLEFVKGVTNYSSLLDHRVTHKDKLSLKIRYTRAGVCQDVGSFASAHFTLKKINEQEEVLSDDSTVTTWTKTISGTTALTGTVAGTAAAYTLTGTSTLFTTELAIGDRIVVSANTYVVSSITSATSLTVATPLVTSPSGTALAKAPSGTDIYYTHDGLVDLDTVELETWIGSQQTCKADSQFTWTIGTQVYHTRLLKTTIDRALYPATVNPTQATDPQRSWVTILQNVDMLPGDADTGNDYLDEVVTVGLQVPRWYQFVRAVDEVMHYYRLRAGTDAENVPTIVRPNDYHATTNAKVFEKEVIAYSGGNGLTDSATATTVTITPLSGTAAVLVSASATDAGILIAADKVRLDAAIITGGSAATLTDLNATQLTSGVIPDARMPNLTGDVTTSEGAVATTIGAGKVTNAMLAGSIDLATKVTGILPDASMPNLTGDVTTVEGAVATTLATVNGNVGSFGSATAAVALTVNAKGLVTAASASTITPAESSVTFTDITTNDATSLKHGYLPKLSGSASDVLKGDGSWGVGGGGAAWGAITGTLTDQADLVAALAERVPAESIVVYATDGTATSYATLALAKAAATSGQLVVVGPGTYAVTASLLKNGVNWYFAAGATVTRESLDGEGILDDGGAGITSTVFGYGNFSVTANAASTANSTRVISTTHASTSLTVFCNDITIDVTPAASCFYGWAVSGREGTLVVSCNDIIADGDLAALAQTATAVYWENAEMSVRGHYAHGEGASVFYSTTTAGKNMYLDFDDISVTGGGVYPASAIQAYLPAALSTVWIQAKTINAYAQTGSLSLISVGGTTAAKNYITAQKIRGLAIIYNGLWYVTADKISASQSVAGDFHALFLEMPSSAIDQVVRWNVREHNAETYDGVAMVLADGTFISREMEYTGTATSGGISVSGATASFSSGLVNTTANSSADTFSISSGTLTLIDTTAVSESTRKDIAHSGGTCTVGGGYGSGTNGVFDVSGTVAFKHPALIDLTSWITGTLPVANGGTGITALGTGVATALGINVGSAGAFVTFNGALGTPSSGTLTSCTGLPISTGVSGLGSNVATFLATPTIANLNSAVSDADLAILGANTFTGAQTIGGALALGATTSAYLTLTNTTAATNGTQQASPALVFTGNRYDTTSASSEPVNMRISMLPIQQDQFGSFMTGSISLQENGTGYADAISMRLQNASQTAICVGGTNWNNGHVYIGAGNRNFNSAWEGIKLSTNGQLGWTTASSGDFTPDTILKRKATATLQMGENAAGVVNQMFTAASRITSDGVGANLTIAGGNGRGGAGGSLIFSTYTTAAAATIGTLTTRLTINTLGEIIPVLPTSAAGLTTGALWNDTGTVKVA